MDDNGHGTHVDGIIAALNNDIGVVGVAPGASLYAVKVLDSTGNGYLSDVIDGIQWSVKNNAQVISMSFGTGTDDLALHDAVDATYNSGVLVIAAAGNTNGGAVTYPAAYSSVIAVSAIDINNSIASFGSVGPQVELAAPGVNVYSTYLGGGYATKSGTSMACPHVSGTVVLILAMPPGTYDQNGNGKWEPAEVRKKLDDIATDLGAPGLDPYYGYGLVNAANATI
jgi:subtilisin family serine protease